MANYDVIINFFLTTYIKYNSDKHRKLRKNSLVNKNKHFVEYSYLVTVMVS